MSDSLALFHPLVQAWFREEVGAPTDVQERAWPRIATGGHVLITAPTGSGKTLAAFLWALDRFARGDWPPGATRILYVSPLKALNNDIRLNLLAPLEAIRGRFEAAGIAFPAIRAQVRSGDTPAPERRRMLRHPPEILITTPESLNLMLLTGAGRDSLRKTAVVILDEIHAVAGTKRGVHLITAVDRLVPLAGDFRRIALSATVRPPERVAALVGGYVQGAAGYVPRDVEIIASSAPKSYSLRVRYPVDTVAPGAEAEAGAGALTGPGAAQAGNGEMDIWAVIAGEIRKSLADARSTLVFTNSRRLSERMARLINEGSERPVAYAHHGSLSREIRRVVETRMKEGSLPAIVATGSLELGIDVGALDQVILVQTPFSIASALQRIGRAGHGAGQTSRGLIFCSHGRDLLDAAVAVKCVLAGDLEETRPVEAPLDVLAQIILSMAASEAWTPDRLFGFLRCSAPYRNLARRQFDLVLEMLAGRFADTRVRELRPRLTVDAVDGRITASKGAVMLAALGGGTIPDRGLYALRHAGSRARIGELDEEFVWERREGDVFGLGSQSWRITNITANEVEVMPAENDAQMAPFWRAEERDRGFHFSNRLGEFLEAADARLDDPGFAQELVRERGFDSAGAESLLGFLRRQKTATGRPLPHRRHVLIEDAGEAQSGEGHRQIILHAVWGGRLLRPWAYALAAAFEEMAGESLDILTGDDCLLVQWPEGGAPGCPAPADLLELAHADNLESLIRRRLERTGYFAAHFRENAARSLLLPRSTLRARVPLWLNRLRSHGLLEAVSAFPDFPVVLETWRECLRDEFDLPALKAMLGEIHSGAIRVDETRTSEPSPFAAGLIWKRTNQDMYEQDKPAQGGSGRGELLREIAFSSPLRPRLPRETIAAFESKAQRLAPGYAPQDAGELAEWAKERLLIPWGEWRRLLPGCGVPEEPEARARHFRHLEARLTGVLLPGAATPAVAAVETLPRLLAALGVAAEDCRLFAPLPAQPTASSRNSQAATGMATAPEAAPLDTPLAAEALANLARMALPTMAGNADPAVAEALSDDGRAALPPLLSQWLGACGPVTLEFLRALFGDAFPGVEEALAELAEGDRIVIDVLSEDAAGAEASDAANLEMILRLMRRRSRPAFRALPAERLPLFLAAWHGVAAPSRDAEGLQESLEKLFGYPAPAGAWEADFLPARAEPYLPSRLDDLIRDSGLLWFGCGREKAAFAFPEDLDLFLPAPSDPEVLSADQAHVLGVLASAAPGRLDFQAISARCPLPSDRIGGALWDLAWMGRIANDTFAALRKGIENGFKTALPGLPPETGGRSRRGHFQRWKAARPAGTWGLLERGDREPDALEKEELAKDRVRQLLRRHGVIFRELLGHEQPDLQWPAVFRALRLLELSGEVLSGHFFDGIAGLQFLSPHALRHLESGPPGDPIYWMSAADPASPCGLGLDGLPYALPPRLASTHIVFHGADLALISRRSGRDLSIRVPPRHKYLAGYLGALGRLTDRAFMPLKVLETESVNGEPALGSPYLEDLLEAGFEKGFKTLSLRKRY